MAVATVSADGTDQRVVLKADDAYPFFRDPAWSPDGRTIAVIRSRGGVAGEIWLLPAAGGAPRQLSHDPPAVFSHEPAFTPDGRGIVHSSNRGGATNLWLAPLDSGPPVRLTSGPGPDEHPSVAADNTVAFLCSRWRHELLVLPVAERQEPRVLVTHGQYLWGPAFSPDGREIAFSQFENDGMWHIWIVPTEGGAARQLTSGAEGEIYPRFAPDGTVLFHLWTKPGSIFAVPRTGGVPRAVTRGPQDEYADVSPDGRQLAFTHTQANVTHVYVAPLAGGEPRLLTTSRATLPRWSPDGTRIVFCPDRSVQSGIFVIGADGTGERRVTQTGGWPVWWPDGSRIAFLRVAPNGTQQLWTAPVEGGEGRLETWARWNAENSPVDLSLDGRLLVTSDGKHQTDEIWLLRPAAATRAQK
jgi:Tol biopolymer transport system component